MEAVLGQGERTFDENRARLSLQNVRVRIQRIDLPDNLIEKYGDKEKIEAVIHLTFKEKEMYDFDVSPSFSPGARSYFARLEEGKMEEFVVKRLSQIPESKKAVISFIHWDDYKAVLNSPHDDYLPCIVSIQFRLLEQGDRYEMTTIFNARSLDVFQKGGGNLIAIAMLSHRIERELNKSLEKRVVCKVMDGLITDAHIYGECFVEAEKIIADYNQQRH